MRIFRPTLLLLLLSTACGQRHTLFQDGQSDYRIVIAADAPETEQYAAQELQTWLREKGFHHLTLRYFEDCEEQVLTIGLHTPDGYDGPLPADRLFLME